MNRLARERSPYLLQHASNPVDWFPWGAEAFARARGENKPIFLSIGYSTCHWCHVMEHESFENPDVAAVLNQHFVSIKVDREERPDVDRVYMMFVQATTGSGGWPMSVWLTPDLKPFLGGTYFPATSRWGRPGFVDILQEVARVWSADRHKIEQSAESVTEQLRTAEATDTPGAIPPAAALSRIVDQFRQSFDSRHAGFGQAPKFPRPSELLFLLREGVRTGDRSVHDMAFQTLHAMALGGMRDHVGGGFHRYSVDAAWRVPHFEKMLYDQAQLAIAYVEAAQASGDELYLDVARDTLRYVAREMTDPSGGFYSAEDADSIPPERATDPGAHKMEGAFYLWRAEELDALLGEDAPIVKARFGVEPEGNAPDDPQLEFVGKNLLFVARSEADLARDFGRSEQAIGETLSRARLQMFEARLGRPRPHLDDKVITAWNGLMIAAFARAARILRARARAEDRGEGETFLTLARHAAEFIRDSLWDPASGALRRRFRDREAAIDAYAEDYACLIFGLIDLFQADANPQWLDWAVALQRTQDALFWDEPGGWFNTTGKDASVLLRMKEDHDGAEPAASSVSVMNLLTLSHLVNELVWTDRIERTLRWAGLRLERFGRAVPMMAAAFSMYTAGVSQVIVVGQNGSDALQRAVAARYLPFAFVLTPTVDQQLALNNALPLIAAMRPVSGQAAAYVCRGFTCRPPVTSPEALEGELKIL